MSKFIYTDEDWERNNRLDRMTQAIREIFEEEFPGLPYYPIEIRTVTDEQMLDNYVSIGLPFLYDHWSFGKQFAGLSRAHDAGMNLAYEMVINSNPCLVYCVEENTMTIQAIVIAHAAFGHNAFFRNNHLFKEWTHADSIIDYMAFAQGYIAECEEKYGVTAVEETIDACHALKDHGSDHYHRPKKLSVAEDRGRQHERAEYAEKHFNVLWPDALSNKKEEKDPLMRFPEEPQENLLYFIEKNAPTLPAWKREIIRIVRIIAQHLYPQGQTRVMNEGFATFVDHHIMHRLYERGLITDASFERFLINHTNLIRQADFDEMRKVTDPRTKQSKKVPIYNGINPYALGFAMFRDIKRICEEPTAEDREWFPDLAGSDWRKELKFAVEMFRDDSFILQYLSPHLIRKFRFFHLIDDSAEKHVKINAIHRDDGYKEVRRALAKTREINSMRPLIEVINVALRGDRTMRLRYRSRDGRPLHQQDAAKTLWYLEKLWEFPVELVMESTEGKPMLKLRMQKGDLKMKPLIKGDQKELELKTT